METVQVTLTLPTDLWTEFLALQPTLSVADAVVCALHAAIAAQDARTAVADAPAQPESPSP